MPDSTEWEYRNPLMGGSNLAIHISDMGRGIDEINIELPTKDFEHLFSSSQYVETLNGLRKRFNEYHMDIVCQMPQNAMKTTAVNKKYFLRVKRK
jgi:hypothetical protein